MPSQRPKTLKNIPSKPVQAHKPFNRRTSLFYCLCWLTACVIGFYFRCYPLFVFGSFEDNEKAATLVMARLKSTVKKAVLRDYPALSEVQKNLKAKELFDDLIRREKDMVKTSIQKVSQEIGVKIYQQSAAEAAKNKKVISL